MKYLMLTCWQSVKSSTVQFFLFMNSGGSNKMWWWGVIPIFTQQMTDFSFRQIISKFKVGASVVAAQWNGMTVGGDFKALSRLQIFALAESHFKLRKVENVFSTSRWGRDKS